MSLDLSSVLYVDEFRASQDKTTNIAFQWTRPKSPIDKAIFLATVLAIFWVCGCIVLRVFHYLWANYKHAYWARRGVHTPLGVQSGVWEPDLAMLYLCPSNGDEPVVGVFNRLHPILLLRSPSVIEQVLVKDSELFFNPRRKCVMAKMGAAFSGGTPKALFPLMLEAAENMRRFLVEKVPNGKGACLDVYGVSTRYTVDVMSFFSFGIRTNSFQTHAQEFYTRTLTLFNRDSISIRIMDSFFPFLWSFFRDTALDTGAYFRNLIRDSLSKREYSGAKRGDVIDLLQDLEDEPKDAPFKINLTSELINLFAAGQGSVPTIAYALLKLSENPEVQKKVRDEILENIGDEGVTYESIDKMTYLNQVISETLRLYPPGELLYRVANENYKIPDTDIVIDKGTVICVPLLGLHRDPAFHPDPLTFDPERFSEERKKDMKPYTYLPFGDGPKQCKGSRIGLMQTAVALITILRNYELYQ